MSRIYINCSESEMVKIKEAFSFSCPFDEGTVASCGEGTKCNHCIETMVKFDLIPRRRSPIYKCAEEFDTVMYRRTIKIFKDSLWRVGECPSTKPQEFSVRMIAIENSGLFIDLTFEDFMEYFDKEPAHETNQTNP